MPKQDASLAPLPPSAMMIRLSPLAGGVMGVFLMAGLAFCLWAIFVSGKVDLLPEKVTWSDIRSGEITHRIARELAGVPLAKRAADLERAASWLIIGDTGARVRQGCPGWLFLADELKLHPHAEANAQARAQKVKAVHDWLAGRGIRLLVLLVPDKSRIAEERLCALARSAQLAGRARQWQARMGDAGVPVLNLAEVLQPLGSAAFLRTDTHWSELGAEAAARTVAAAIVASGVTPTPHKAWQRSQEPARIRPGDLVRLAGLDWLPERLQPAPEAVSASIFSADEAQDAMSEDDLFGDSQLPNIALIGTSFSRNSNFVPFLEQALGTSLGNFARDGGEFSAAARAYFASAAFGQTPPQLLVWEIPERDLQTPYQDDIVLPAGP
ncbi:alginate O-acetyltransferase AlgX-related protein [Phytopseudomonas dryadis]|uniref:Cell division protein FtsQ n=1 Tax=Phytopseudomonas dryadis TaxID=2487520 RepID=A0A4Q9R576_9GAMM|nr:cell division protein FtsQ [Pseudomonas dryadis]TBU95619.1 cell division protein FtsQ [Pseudomonas dryadis]